MGHFFPGHLQLLYCPRAVGMKLVHYSSIPTQLSLDIIQSEPDSKIWTPDCLRPANERRHYFVTTSLIGWMQTLDWKTYVAELYIECYMCSK